MSNFGRFRAEKDLLEERAAIMEDIEQVEKSLEKESRGMTSLERLDFDRRTERLKDLNTAINRGREHRDRKSAEAEARYTGVKPGSPMPAKAAAIRSIMEDGVTSVTESTVFAAVKRNVTSTTAADTIQDPNITGEVIQKPLQNGALGTLRIDIRDGIVNHTAIAKLKGYPGISTHAEMTEIAAGTLIVAPIQWDLKNFASRVDMANNVSRDAVADWPQVINDAFNTELEHTATKQVLAGAGGTEMTGIDNYTDVQTVDAGSATLTWDMILSASQKVMAKNVDPTKIGIIMHPVAWLQLQSLKDTTGQQITKPSGLEGMPIVVHTAVGTEYGAGSDETRVYVGDFSTCKLGVGGKYEITSEKSKADHDMTQFIMVYRADLQLFHPEHIVRIENVAIA